MESRRAAWQQQAGQPENQNEMQCLHALRGGHEKPPPARKRVASATPKGPRPPPAYFCQVRFLWRLARSFLRRLCLFILLLRRFFNDPIIIFHICGFNIPLYSKDIQ
jgi:hypothetical protein